MVLFKIIFDKEVQDEMAGIDDEEECTVKPAVRRRRKSKALTKQSDSSSSRARGARKSPKQKTININK